MNKETLELLKPLLDKHPPEIIIALMAELLGWDIAIPGDPNEPCDGIIIGNTPFIGAVVGSLQAMVQNAEMDNIALMMQEDFKKTIN